MGNVDPVDKKIRPSGVTVSQDFPNAAERERLKTLILAWLNGPQKDPTRSGPNG